jgi:hypothetical protein
MKTCLVSLISDQTIPNILVAAQYKPDYLLFITTPSMERKRKCRAILGVLKQRGSDYSQAFHKIVVTEDSIEKIQSNVSKWLDQEGKEYHFIVNLTGGTKIMAIAAFELFNGYDSIMGYVPIPRNEFLLPFPKKQPREPVSLDERLTVVEYLIAYGFRITNKAVLERNKQEAWDRSLISTYIFDHYDDVRPLLKCLGDSIRQLKERQLKKGYDLCVNSASENKAQAELEKKLGFKRNGLELTKRITKSEWNYLRGGWLEECVFLSLTRVMSPQADIELSVVSNDPMGNKNEFDIMFTHENAIFIVECKSLDAPEGDESKTGGNINNFLYKLGALRQNFGLTPRTYLATTSRNIFDEHGDIKTHLIERGKQFSTEIIPLVKVKNLDLFFQEKFS